jgi:hypothetical protein
MKPARRERWPTSKGRGPASNPRPVSPRGWNKKPPQGRDSRGGLTQETTTSGRGVYTMW